MKDEGGEETTRRITFFKVEDKSDLPIRFQEKQVSARLVLGQSADYPMKAPFLRFGYVKWVCYLKKRGIRITSERLLF